MKLRSLFFVPADRPERFTQAAASGADALILDLENTVAPEKKKAGRAAIALWLSGERQATTFVRVNPLDGGLTDADLAALLPAVRTGSFCPRWRG